MNQRTCPFCGHRDSGGIRAVLNEIRGKRLYVARCRCPKCDRTWDEHFNKSTGDGWNYPVSHSSRPMKEPFKCIHCGRMVTESYVGQTVCLLCAIVGNTEEY